jgi:hypothetical protein
MREVLKSFIPRQHWAASNVEVVPTVANVTQLAKWGGVGVFTAFWMIGTAICVLLFLRSLSLSFVFENNLSFVADPFLLPDPSLLYRTTSVCDLCFVVFAISLSLSFVFENNLVCR